MSKEWKERLEKIGISVVTAVPVLILTAIIKGDELKGLGKVSGFFRVLNVGIPLWLFVIVLVIAMLGGFRWYKSRKKTLIHVEWKNDISLWCVANAGEERWMQVMLHGFFNNADPNIALIITSVYLEGTKPAMSLYDPFTLPPQHVSTEDVSIMVKPVLLEEGKTFCGNVILVDQFQRKHKSYIELKGHAPQVQTKPDAAKSAT